MAVKSFVAFEKLTADEMNNLLSTKTTRNYAYNSGFDVYQRGSVTTSGGYTLDRWYASTSASNATVTQDSTVIAPNARYSAKITANGTATMAIRQALETADVYLLAGKTVTLSAYIASSGPTSNLNMVLEYSTSVDNSITGTWTAIDTATSQALSTTMTLISATYSVPDTAKSLRITFITASSFSSTQAFYVGNVQLEQGNFVSPFNRMGKTYSDELQLCQRYYQRIVTSVNLPWAFGHAQTSTEVRVGIPLPITMRTDPTLTVSANPTVANGTFSAFVSTTLTQSTNLAWIRITVTGATAGSPAAIYGNGTYELSAEL